MRGPVKWSFLAIAMILNVPARGDMPVPQDFAFGFRVDIESPGALCELDIPDAVYRDATRADLGDIRVFNSAGQVIPHVLRRPGTESGQAPASVAVPFFPLYTQNGADIPKQTLRIITDKKGTIIDAAGLTAAADESHRVTAYLLDISALEKAPDRLKLDWTKPEDAGFTVGVEVASSDDLTHWSSLVKAVTLADLKSGDAVLSRDEIELPVYKARYLRITWPEELHDVRLTGVLASFRAREKPPKHRWLEVRGTADESNPYIVVFDTGGYWPADTARMNFKTSNVVVHATLSSRATGDAGWQTRHSGIFYTLEHDGTTLESEPARFKTTSDRYWRFMLADKDRRLPGNAPTLVLGWRPYRLTFVVEGEPPYTVAFGNAALTGAARPVDSLLQEIDEEQEKGLIVAGRTSSVFVLGGKGRLEPPAAPFPWKTTILWVVLVAGIALLAAMVRSLWRKMSIASGSSAKHDQP